MKKKSVLKSLLLFAVVVMISRPAFAVVDGELDGDDHPYVGQIVWFDAEGNGFACSGMLLSPTVFLTAGHCTADAVFSFVTFAESGFSTGLGSADSFSDEFHTHPGFSGAFGPNINSYDVGVVILAIPVEMDEYAELPELGVLDAKATRRGRQDVSLDVVGYGLQYIRQNFFGNVVTAFEWDLNRYQGKVNLANLRNAIADGSNIMHTNDAGRGNDTAGACFGDSGGPVFLPGTNTVVGIVSFGLNQNCVGVGFAYRTDIAATQDFVNLFLN